MPPVVDPMLPKNRKLNWPAISRRSFVERLGLGVGAGILSPIANTLIKQARGQTMNQKRFMVFIMGSGMQPDTFFTPQEMKAGIDSANLAGSTNFTWPAAFAPLAKYKNRIVLMDGFANRPPVFGPVSNHTVGFCALSCRPPPTGSFPEFGPPGGITIDQHIANTLSDGMKFKSISAAAPHFLYDPNHSEYPKLFATGANQPIKQVDDPRALWSTVFAGVGGTGTPVVDTSPMRKRLLLDAIRHDINKLQGSLAGAERKKLDDYLATLSDFEKRIMANPTVTCAKPTQPTVTGSGVFEDGLQAQMDTLVMALACGLTNVVGLSAGAGNSHATLYDAASNQATAQGWRRIPVTIDLHESNRATYAAAFTQIHAFFSGVVARGLDTLSGIMEGDKSIADNLVILYTSDNGEDHHSEKERWPVMLIGDAGSGAKIKSGGRFLRFPPRNGQANRRALADLYSTIATAVGVPTNNFGMGGNQPTQGPIADLLA